MTGPEPAPPAAEARVAQYPVALILTGRRCLVVGGGPVAARKAEALVACGAVVDVVARRVGPEMAALGLDCQERDYRRGDATGYRLVVAATDDPAVNQAVYEDAEAAGVWVNAADDPASCSFMLPAVARQGPITVAVSTGGASPAMASWLRDRVAAQLGPEHEQLAALLAEHRTAMKAAGRPTEGSDWRRALDSDMLDLIRAGRTQQARERLDECL